MNEFLFSLKGRFVGRGVNHEGQDFTGTLEAKPQHGRGLYFMFDAVGDDGRLYHGETSLVGMNIDNKPALWVLSSNHPGVFERPLKRHEASQGSAIYVFGFGNPIDRSTFREEVALTIGSNFVKYVYSWGLPGGDFAERSGCKMELTNTT